MVFYCIDVVDIHSISHVQLLATPRTVAHHTLLSSTFSQSLLKKCSLSVMPSSHLILCRSLLLTSIFPSIRVFSNESVLHIRWPKYWRFTFSISPPNEYSGLISYGIEWFDLLAVQGALESLLQCHRWKASILWCSAFFKVQLSHPYTITGKMILLTIWTFVGSLTIIIFSEFWVLDTYTWGNVKNFWKWKMPIILNDSHQSISYR